jgi:superfamily II DNA/RNA helicase
VLVHTRELAVQVHDEFERFKKWLRPLIRCKIVSGGVPVAIDKKELKASVPHIVIGTPGRTLQLAKEGILKLGQVKFFVLDECDKMLEAPDMRSDVQGIFKMTPHTKQVMMFSATLAPDIRETCKRFMHNPKEICINEGAKLTLHGLQQYYIHLEEKEKNRKLIDLLDALEFNQVIIFVKSVDRADYLNNILTNENFPSICTYGRKNHNERIDNYRTFKKFGARILVTTNLMGRGVDFERVNVVINYDMAPSEDAYLHRVGRAGRFGTKGLAISFITTSEDKEILEKIRKKFVVDLPELPDTIDSATYMTA